MANIKEIQRTNRMEIRMSDIEKEVFYAYAKECGINPSRLARNIILEQAESILGKVVYKPLAKGYVKYCKITKNLDALERLATP